MRDILALIYQKNVNRNRAGNIIPEKKTFDMITIISIDRYCEKIKFSCFAHWRKH